jgi:hypothetical protein
MGRDVKRYTDGNGDDVLVAPDMLHDDEERAAFGFPPAGDDEADDELGDYDDDSDEQSARDEARVARAVGRWNADDHLVAAAVREYGYRFGGRRVSACLACGGKMPPGARSDAYTCGATCRRRFKRIRDGVIVTLEAAQAAIRLRDHEAAPVRSTLDAVRAAAAARRENARRMLDEARRLDELGDAQAVELAAILTRYPKADELVAADVELAKRIAQAREDVARGQSAAYLRSRDELARIAADLAAAGHASSIGTVTRDPRPVVTLDALAAVNAADLARETGGSVERYVGREPVAVVDVEPVVAASPELVDVVRQIHAAVAEVVNVTHAARALGSTAPDELVVALCDVEIRAGDRATSPDAVTCADCAARVAAELARDEAARVAADRALAADVAGPELAAELDDVAPPPASKAAPVPSGPSPVPIRGLSPIERIALIACAASKVDTGGAALPACELYASELFRKAAADVNARKAVRYWWILSAKHGLTDPHKRIAPYELDLTKASNAERERWAARVVDELDRSWVGDYLRGGGYLIVELHTGAKYGDALRPALVAKYGDRVRAEGVGDGQPIGKRLRTYNQRAEQRAAAAGGAK